MDGWTDGWIDEWDTDVIAMRNSAAVVLASDIDEFYLVHAPEQRYNQGQHGHSNDAVSITTQLGYLFYVGGVSTDESGFSPTYNNQQK